MYVLFPIYVLVLLIFRHFLHILWLISFLFLFLFLPFSFLAALKMPWYEKYKLEFTANSHAVEHEFFHHPIACMRIPFRLLFLLPHIIPYLPLKIYLGIIAASSDDQNPIGALVKLFDPSSPPSIFSESYPPL